MRRLNNMRLQWRLQIFRNNILWTKQIPFRTNKNKYPIRDRIKMTKNGIINRGMFDIITVNADKTKTKGIKTIKLIPVEGRQL